MAKAAPRDVQTRKQELLDDIVRFLEKNGARDLSVRALADAVGTSHRMLLYYFGSKEELLREVYAALRLRFFHRFTDDSSATFHERVRGSWDHLLKDRPTYNILSELLGLALLYPETYKTMLADYLQTINATWAEALARAGVPEDRVDRLATLIASTSRGLQIDWLVTGDAERTTQGVDDLLDLIDAVVIDGTWVPKPLPKPKPRKARRRS